MQPFEVENKRLEVGFTPQHLSILVSVFQSTPRIGAAREARLEARSPGGFFVWYKVRTPFTILKWVNGNLVGLNGICWLAKFELYSSV